MKKYLNQNYDFLRVKKLHVKKSRIDYTTIWERVAYSHSDAVRAFFYVALTIARTKASYTIGENLIKPAAVEMGRIMCDKVFANKLAIVWLSNNTINRRNKKLSIFCSRLLLL